MAKKRYLTITSILIFIVMAVILEPNVNYYSYVESTDTSYIIMGIIFLMFLGFLIFSNYVFYVKDKPIFLHAYTTGACLYIIIEHIIIGGYNAAGIIFLAVLPALALCVLYFLGNRLLSEYASNIRPFHFLSVLFFNALLLVFFDSFFVGVFLGYIITAIIALTGYLLYLLPKNEIGFHIIIGLFMAAAIVLLFVELFNWSTYYGSLFGCLFISLIVILYGSLYFVLCFSRQGKHFISKFALLFVNSAAKMQQEQKTSSILDHLDELETLKKLLDENLLTEEEFQTQKEKILGGK